MEKHVVVRWGGGGLCRYLGEHVATMSVSLDANFSHAAVQ
jgi:hypothetical protein